MKFLHILYVFALLSFLPIRLTAQDVPVSSEIVEDVDDIDADSSSLSCNDSSAIIIPGFDTTQVPAANLYKSWNHFFVNPYDTSLTKKPDTTNIDLKGYFHPKNNYLTSDFGFRRYRQHYGVDIKVQTGDTIYASFDGMIRICKYSRSFGNYVVIRHYNGLETVYAHLTRSLVSLNEVVKAGEPIGLGGSTGHSTGPHLHFEVRFLGQCINPHDIIDFDTYSIKAETFSLTAKNFAYIAELQKIRYHVVRRGDTLGKIAHRYGTTVSRLCKLNKIRPSKLLRLGQRIRYT